MLRPCIALGSLGEPRGDLGSLGETSRRPWGALEIPWGAVGRPWIALGSLVEAPGQVETSPGSLVGPLWSLGETLGRLGAMWSLEEALDGLGNTLGSLGCSRAWV